jgi:carotenoid cleavage dioxygenase-like enzyme
MAVDFRGHPMFPATGFNAPTRFEADIYDCEVWGKVPSDIEGTFYRIQCDFQYRPPQNEWPTGFNGDGMVNRFRFKDGNVSFRARYVKTDRLLAEREAHTRLYGVYRNHYTDHPSVAKLERSAANTHLYWHGGKMLVLKEDALPWVINPHSLETQGLWTFDGRWTATSMSAHPKIDPVTGEMIAYAYQAKGDLTDDVAVYTISPRGVVTHEVWFKAPYVGIMHDMAITRNHVVIPLVARTTSEARLKSGEPMWQWDANLPTMVAVLPRGGSSKDVRWFKGPARNTLHFLNAVEHADGRITMDLPTSSGERDASQLRRWTFNLRSKKDSFDEEIISQANGVLVRMDDRYLSLPYRYAFGGNRNPSQPFDRARAGNMGGFVTNEYHRIDVSTGKSDVYFVGPVQSLQECCFVPRKGSTAEGDGYLMGVASNFESMSSDLVIVDAQRLQEGAIATVKLPFRLRSGTHTNWFGAEELPPFAA